MKTNYLLSGIAALLLAAVPALADPPVRTREVDCGAGSRLGDALSTRGESLTVRFRGTCTERITISRDDVTLEGADTSATIVGQVLVDGASRVVLANFTVRDTPGTDPFESLGDGVIVRASHKVTLRGITTRNNGRRGISIEEASADIVDSKCEGAGGTGIQALGSFINFFGTTSVTGAVGPGILIGSSTHAFLKRHARLSATGNAVGFVVQGNGTVTVANESFLIVDDNLFLGILVTSQGDILHGTADIQVNGNGGYGVLVSEFANWTPFAGFPATVRISGNAAGMRLERGGFAELTPGTFITGNPGPGLEVDDSRLVIGETVVRDNAGGDLFFAARASVISNGGNDLGSPPVCDDTVLLRGDLTCAPVAPAAASKALPATPPARLEEIRKKIRSLLGGV